MKKLYNAQQIREADNFAINEKNIPGIVLMENAAINISEIIENTLLTAGSAEINSIAILCGKGNNGGDGYAVARHLVNSGYPVDIISFAGGDELNGDALINYTICKKYESAGENLVIHNYENISSLEKIVNSNVIIDALLGTGTSGSLREPYGSVIKFVNDLPALKIAIDAPTGLDCNTGWGELIFESDITVTLAGLKQGLFIEQGYVNTGEVYLGSIGMGDDYFESLTVDSYLVEQVDCKEFLPEKRSNIHKYSAGKVFVMAGSGELPGAALFSAQSTFESGAGAVVLGFPKSLRDLAVNNLSGPTVKTYGNSENEYFSNQNLVELESNIEKSDVTILGPGLGRETATIRGVRELLEKFPDKPMVLDADAIYALNDGEWKNYNLETKIFTPHHMEFANLLGIEISGLKKDILSYGRTFAKESGAILVLKGAPTVIFDVDGSAYINSTGNRGMAKFGTGDVLTGIIGSFVAQGHEPVESVIAAVYIHSLAGDMATEELSVYSVTPEILMDYFPEAIKKVTNADI